jgi:uncharacterized iron-regulated protein
MMMRCRSRAFGLAVACLLGWVLAGCAAAPPQEPAVGVVLLGETHDRAADHRWQLAQIEALYAREPGLAIGLEMVPRSRQAALDDWTAGKLDEAQFLRAVDWQNSWGFDYALYRPVFDFARAQRVPMLALNVDRAVVRAVGKGGWPALQAWPDLALGRPAAPQPAYSRYLAAAFAGHGQAKDSDALNRGFARFTDVQLLWDRAMAVRIADARVAGVKLVVVLAGSGHVRDGWGIGCQLQDLGIASTALVAPEAAATP